MGCQPGISPDLGRVPEILWFLACDVNDTGFFFVSNLRIATTTKIIDKALSTPPSVYFFRQSITLLRLVPTLLAISSMDHPSAFKRSIRTLLTI